MIHWIIAFSVRNKLIIALMVLGLVIWGGYSLTQIPIGAVPDITNNQVQVITTSRNLGTEEVEKYITYQVELEMANLPGVKEIRSISKFGLSVVTVVFDESMGTYLPRQLISEKLVSARENIPAQFGTPEMGPISTGLGEIYQYILDVEPGYESKYSTMDLRDIQDWIVRRQLSGIPGVVEVITWGGLLKQYEVSVNPQKLHALNVSITDVLGAIEKNNDVSGGGYIEKSDETYFIRGDGLVKSLEDIEQIAVRTRNGVSVLVKDIAKVQYGFATRFGAITGNGEGEKVMGQVMMLKNANSNDVIGNVKERVREIQKTLPEGVIINPFLERTELIDKTTSTIKENLLLGALIVIFVLVVLLGNFRSGLIVASLIPLSLLFGISLMNLFGVSANLMSLGAIDFGIIIDGAIIIVEYILFQFTRKQDIFIAEGKDQQKKKDDLTIESARKVMQPAIFGQIIILIVFIPILALSGIEGKMFVPMALSFSFTLLGAMWLSLTYVPMISALICSANRKNNLLDKLSDRIMKFLYGLYRPVINIALNSHKLVLSIAIVLLSASVFIFSRMGGEFIPTLDEGDFVVQPVLKTGTSLSKTIEIMTQLENILLDNFPEVDQVVTRIGAAEVPTDPMSMEEADVIIKLKPKDQWVSAYTKEELAEKMKSAMLILPGVDFEFTQPIEMRFNELITGVRSDVAIKIYGENLDSLNYYAGKVKSLIATVEGAEDIVVEKTDNLPQINIDYDRNRLASFGLNTKDLNQIVRTAIGGEDVGVVYEGEKNYNLVVKFDKEFRKDTRHLENLKIDLPSGAQVPFKQIGNVTYESGPAKISRDDTRRRIVIGINIRNRDVASMVEEIQGILSSELDLPSGYYLTYGGQFENLQSAVKRLQLAVPAALLLIFIMLHFAFRSFRQSLLVYSAIPLAAIGGVLALWMRDLPFSISAGIGFIALFGIAVLNGIVLIEFFNELKKEGVTNIKERVLTGTKQRLRPVLLTALSAALGFFPMAFSSSVGAEVQRPLATVVIGGLFTSTILTLVVLPVLYMMFGEKKSHSVVSPKAVMILMLFGSSFLFSSGANAQKPETQSLEELIDVALENNLKLRASELEIERNGYLEKAAIDFGKTSVYYAYDKNNLAENGYPLNVYGISQSIPFPTVLGAQKKVASSKKSISEVSYEIEKERITRDVSKLYYQLANLMQKIELFDELDILFGIALKSVERRHELGSADQLELLNARSHFVSLQHERGNLVTDRKAVQLRFTQLLQIDSLVEITPPNPEKIGYSSNGFVELANKNLGNLHQEQLLMSTKMEEQLEKKKRLPAINLEYFLGVGTKENAQNFAGYQVGISLPLLSGAQRRRSQAKSVASSIQNTFAENYELLLKSVYEQLNLEVQNSYSKLSFYEEEALEMADELLNVAQRKYVTGESGFNVFIQSVENAQKIKLDYLSEVNTYNQLVIDLTYLIID